MLYGIDISHHNRLTENMMEHCDFIIHKATEGRSYKDPTLMSHMGEWYYHCEQHSKPALRGYYHFARPQNGNSVQDELANFMNYCPLPMHRSIPILDVEDGAENYPEWCYEWLQLYYEETGVKPMLYTSQSNVKKLKKVATLGCGLWVAHYKSGGNAYPVVKPGDITPWPFWALWQWSNGSQGVSPRHPYVPGKVDQDIFNGSVTAWKKYAMGDHYTNDN